MTNKELKHIESKIEQFHRWAEEERQEAARSHSFQERDEHRIQAQLNDCAGDTLRNLLADLGTGEVSSA